MTTKHPIDPLAALAVDLTACEHMYVLQSWCSIQAGPRHAKKTSQLRWGGNHAVRARSWSRSVQHGELRESVHGGDFLLLCAAGTASQEDKVIVLFFARYGNCDSRRSLKRSHRSIGRFRVQ